eukprot:4893985-Pleurochrysis_carterae.AAC.1
MQANAMMHNHKVHACAAPSFTKTGARYMACPQFQDFCLTKWVVGVSVRARMCIRRSSGHTCCQVSSVCWVVQAVLASLPARTDASDGGMVRCKGSKIKRWNER